MGALGTLDALGALGPLGAQDALDALGALYALDALGALGALDVLGALGAMEVGKLGKKWQKIGEPKFCQKKKLGRLKKNKKLGDNLA